MYSFNLIALLLSLGVAFAALRGGFTLDASLGQAALDVALAFAVLLVMRLLGRVADWRDRRAYEAADLKRLREERDKAWERAELRRGTRKRRHRR